MTDEPPSLILAGTKMWLAIQENDTAQMQMYQKQFELAKADYAKNRDAVNTVTPRIIVRNFGSFR